ncbi:MAG TPA: DUF1707 domain-containing protein [Solirubrobacteraceae bacterium]|nr:DUF1707 domain-containing protein [Solirubrobacteraceae bacterium]
MHRRHLRASDAERDEIVERLRRAATEGRIAADELEQRVSEALKARTYGELEATVADLPRERRPPERLGAGRARGAASLALTVARRSPCLAICALPIVAAAALVLLAITISWAVLMVAMMVLGVRHRAPRGPWMYTRQHQVIYGPRRRARSYWA